jgi:hypothetical protein
MAAAEGGGMWQLLTPGEPHGAKAEEARISSTTLAWPIGVRLIAVADVE